MEKSIFIFWVIIMFLVTFTCSIVYLTSQQSLRLGANGLPAQLAVETSIKLNEGQIVKSAIPTQKVDISKSLNAFVMVFDKNKNLIDTSGIMGGSTPTYPEGVLENVDKNGENRVTWQPETGLRFATVAIKFDHGYIVAAQPLLETEKLIGSIGNVVLISWLACTGFSAFGLGIIYFFMNKTYKLKKL
jgi:hypothetical protein